MGVCSSSEKVGTRWQLSEAFQQPGGLQTEKNKTNKISLIQKEQTEETIPNINLFLNLSFAFRNSKFTENKRCQPNLFSLHVFLPFKTNEKQKENNTNETDP